MLCFWLLHPHPHSHHTHRLASSSTRRFFSASLSLSSLPFPTLYITIYYFQSRIKIQHYYSSHLDSSLSLHPLRSPPFPLLSQMADLKSTFLNVYSVLKSELLHDPAFEWSDDSRQWADRVSISIHPSIHLSSFILFCFVFHIIAPFEVGV